MSGQADGGGRVSPPAGSPAQMIEAFSDYTIEQEIGRGGMGVIYRARDRQGTTVAIKILLARHNTYEEDLKRFQREAQFTIELDHPNIIKTRSIGVVQGNYYIITDFLEGIDLQRSMLRHILTTVEACTIAHEIARGLQYAHGRGILHRDLKPANIMLAPGGGVKILDFGLAKQVDASTRLTLTGTVLGTPAYMSPEQAAGEAELTPASDLYGLGVVLYEMLARRTPHQAESPIQMLRKVIEKEPPPIRRVCPDIPRSLEIIVGACLEREPRHRYPTADDLARDLEAFLANRPIQARPRPRLARWLDRLKQHRRAIAVAAILAVNFILVLVILQLRYLVLQRQLEARLRTQEAAATWTQVVADRFDKDDPGAWYAGAGGWERRQMTVVGSTPLDLPVRGEHFSLLQAGLMATGPVLAYEAGYDPAQHAGTRVVFRFEKDDTPDSIAGIEVYQDDMLVARNYRIRLVPRRYYDLQVKIEESRVSISVDGRPAVYFNGIMPLKTTLLPFRLVPDGNPVNLSSLVLFRKKLPPKTISGDNFFREKMYAKARQYYLKVAEDHPDLDVAREARFKAGMCLELDERPAEALETYRQFTKADGEWYPRALCHAWLCHIRLKDTAGADLILSRFREDFSLYDMLAQVPFQTLRAIFDFYCGAAEGEPDPARAADLFNRAAETAAYLGLDDEAFDTRTRMADGFRQRGEYDLAVAELRRAQADHPALADKRAWNQLRIAEIFRLKDDADAADREYQKVIHRYPEAAAQRSWARLWLAEMALDAGRPEKARAYAAPAVLDAGLPQQAAGVLCDNADLPDLAGVNPFFRNDLLYFKAVALLGADRRAEAVAVLQQALLAGRAGDWPEELIRRRLAALTADGTGASHAIF